MSIIKHERLTTGHSAMLIILLCSVFSLAGCNTTYQELHLGYQEYKILNDILQVGECYQKIEERAFKHIPCQ